jgi:putative transposase
MRLQAMLYYDVRGRFGLSANLTQQAFRRVAANRKAARAQGEAVKTFDPTSIQYDQRIFSFTERDWTVSLTLLHGRVRLQLHLGNYQRGKLRGQRPTSAQLCKHRDGAWAVHIQIKIPVPTPMTSSDVLGVDLGRTDIAHISDGESWDGSTTRQYRDHYSRMRAALNHKASKGTRAPAPQERQAPDSVAVGCWTGCRAMNNDSNATPITLSPRRSLRRHRAGVLPWLWKI